MLVGGRVVCGGGGEVEAAALHVSKRTLSSSPHPPGSKGLSIPRRELEPERRPPKG